MLKNLQSKLLTLLVLSTVLPVSAVGIYSISSSTKALTNLNVNQIENEVSQQTLRMENILSDVYDDVLMLSKMPPIQGIIRARQNRGIDQNESHTESYTTYQDWVNRLGKIFQAFISSKKQYTAIQYLDENGKQLVQVTTDDTNFSYSQKAFKQSVPKEVIQATLRLKSGQVYISPILLDQPDNSPDRRTKLAPQSVIYYATPIYNQAGDSRGIIVITLLVRSLANYLPIDEGGFDETIFLTTQNGDYLIHSNPNRLWQKNNDFSTRLATDYPTEIVKQILDYPRGSLQTNDGRIISHQKINPGLNNQMVLVYDLPKYTVLGSVSQLKRISLAIVLVSLGSAIVIGGSIIRRISKNQTSLYEQAQAAALTAEEKARELEHTLHELHQTQTQLVQTEKMSSLGQLVAGVAHEINNPVNFIYGNLNHVKNYSQDLLQVIRLYQQYYPVPHTAIQTEIEDIDLDFLMDDMPKMLESMKVGADRIRQIVLSLRNFSRIDESAMKAVDIHEGIDSTLLILQNRTKAHGTFPGVEVIKHYGQLPPVECYAGQLNQVFMNILSNAIDALEETIAQQPKCTWTPTITIHTDVLAIATEKPTDSLSAPEATRITTQTPDSQPAAIRIRIADNGAGIPPAVRDRLFEAFFTTKPIGKGTGLGLSISYQIVTERHGGKLQCFSEVGRGTEFWIEIPVQQCAIAPASPEPTSPSSDLLETPPIDKIPTPSV